MDTTSEFSDIAVSDKVKVWRMPGLPSVELLHARHFTHTFHRHTHEQYAIGMIEHGALGFYYRHENWLAPAGSINLCIPGEVHTGHAAIDEGWTYRMFYLDPEFLQRIAAELTGFPRDIPFFKPGVIDDPVLARQINHIHTRLEQQDTTLLESETAILETLARLVIRHADTSTPVPSVPDDPQAVTKVKDYLQTYHAQDVSLDDLSRLTHLTRFHLLRVFHNTVGIPPHAYLRQVRVQQAKNLLADQTLQLSIADVATATGFTDQSHLTKWFKRLWGFTPGQYRNSVLYR